MKVALRKNEFGQKNYSIKSNLLEKFQRSAKICGIIGTGYLKCNI